MWWGAVELRVPDSDCQRLRTEQGDEASQPSPVDLSELCSGSYPSLGWALFSPTSLELPEGRAWVSSEHSIYSISLLNAYKPVTALAPRLSLTTAADERDSERCMP